MEKTEKPTPKRLKKAREEGETYSSKPFESFIKILLAFALLLQISPLIFKVFRFTLSDVDFYSANTPFTEKTRALAISGLILILIILVIASILDIVLPLIYRGNIASTISFAKGIERYFRNLNPAVLFSKQRLISLLLTIVKVVIFIAIGILIIKNNIFFPSDTNIINPGTPEIMLIFIKKILTAIIFAGVLIGIVDLIYERQKYIINLYMTKQEIKEEYKNEEGDPHIKSQQKRFRQSILFSDPKKDVKRAKFLLVNPTHIAIPIIYSEETGETPQIGYIGIDDQALQMIGLARVHSIPIVKNIPLAREFFKTYESGDEIDEKDYEIIASILSLLMSLEFKIDFIDMDNETI
jgi:flagellar biosynthesis protein FlhB